MGKSREQQLIGESPGFLAVLELIKGSLIELVQAEPFAPIHIRAAGSTTVYEENLRVAAAGES